MSADRTQPESISVVVQGPVHPEDTVTVAGSIREHLPGAELILSTWKGSDVSFIEDQVDEIVFNEDPGAYPMCTESGKYPLVQNNVNRQIVSSAGGIARATRPYVLRLRNDLVLTGANGFLDAVATFDAFDDRYRFVERRIIGNGSGARNPSLYSYCFHPGDFFFFGARADLKALFDIPLDTTPKPLMEAWATRQAELDAAGPSRDESRLMPVNRPADSWQAEFCPEVYIFRTFLIQHGAPIESFSNFLEYGAAWREQSLDYLVNQFVLMNDAQLGIRSIKYPEFERNNFEVSLDWKRWLEAYATRFELTPDQRATAARLSALSEPSGLTEFVKKTQLSRPSPTRSLRGLMLNLIGFAALVVRYVSRPGPTHAQAKLLVRQVKRYRRAASALGS